MEFSQRKFQRLPHARKEKNLAEFLEEIYKKALDGVHIDLAPYNQIAGWLGLEPLSPNLRHIADRFHFHLKRGGQSRKEHALLPEIRRGDQLEGADFLPVHIYLDKIRSAHNVGSILRTTEAFRLGSVHFSPSMQMEKEGPVQKAAMGADKWVTSDTAALQALPRPYIALETGVCAQPIFQASFPDTFTLVVGNEEYGISDDVLAQIDQMVEIPLVGRKNSLNVANAFAIAAAFIHKEKRGGR